MKKGINSAAVLAAAITGFVAFPTAAAADERDQEGCAARAVTSFVLTEITFPNAQPDQDLSGVMAGVAVGCLYQFDDNGGLTLGANLRGVFGELEDAQNDGNEIRQFGTSDSLVALTLEVGYEFDNDAYVYFEAGQGWMSVEQREQCMDPATIPFGFCRPANGYAPYDLAQEQTETGLALGVGARFFIGDGWSLGGRYTRYQMEGEQYTLGPASNGLNLPIKQVEDHDVEELSVELTWNF